MADILISETWVNQTEHYIIGENEPYEPYTNIIKDLFTSLQREYGKCVSKMYIDTNEESKQIGWVFEKKVKYTDCDKTYIQETWITLHKSKPKKIIQHDYYYL